MRNIIIRRVIILGAFAILSILAVQTYWVRRTWDLQEREFNRKVNQALLDAAGQLAVMTPFDLPKLKLVSQVSSNYWVVNVNNVFEADDLEFCLDKAFETQGLKEDYEYGIFDCTSDRMVKGKLVKYSPGSANKMEISAPLPKHADSDFDYYFGVQFIGKTSNILSTMWIVNAFTVLMLITVVFFIYSMFIILRQKQLSELQRDFINNMTHEFKTPISTINISTDVFLQHEKIKEDPRLGRYAGIIKEQVLRLNTQVEKVLQLAKIDRDNMELNVEEINLADLIQNISPTLEMKIKDKQGSLTLALEADNAIIRADRLHLTNILHNLVDNGVKYSIDKPEISIRLQNEQGKLLLSVQDKGIGISKENQKRVFDKFYRIPTGNVHNVKGFGLGLFYVKMMCKEHKWRLSLDSAVGKGTTIRIEMPQER